MPAKIYWSPFKVNRNKNKKKALTTTTYQHTPVSRVLMVPLIYPPLCYYMKGFGEAKFLPRKIPRGLSPYFFQMQVKKKLCRNTHSVKKSAFCTENVCSHEITTMSSIPPEWLSPIKINVYSRKFINKLHSLVIGAWILQSLDLSNPPLATESCNQQVLSKHSILGQAQKVRTGDKASVSQTAPP